MEVLHHLPGLHAEEPEVLQTTATLKALILAISTDLAEKVADVIDEAETGLAEVKRKLIQ